MAFLKKLFCFVTKPHGSISGTERFRARLILSISGLFVLMTCFGLTSVLAIGHAPSGITNTHLFTAFIGLLAFGMLTTFALSKTTKYEWGIHLYNGLGFLTYGFYFLMPTVELFTIFSSFIGLTLLVASFFYKPKVFSFLFVGHALLTTLTLGFVVQGVTDNMIAITFATYVSYFSVVWVALHLHELKNIELQKEKVKTTTLTQMASMGEVAAGLAHEMSRPLAKIEFGTACIEAQLAAKELNIDEIKAQVTSVNQVVKKLSETIRELKEVSRERSVDYYEFYSIQEIVDEAKYLSENEILNAGVHFKVRPFMDLQIMCRPTDIIQVLVNLITNASKAIQKLPYDQKWIEVKIQLDDKYVYLEVEDGSEALSKDDVESIFRPFAKGGFSKSSRDISLGLSSQLIESHSGELYYNSRSVNSCFTVKVPILQTDIEPKAS